MAGQVVLVNRAPVLTLWAAVVAERLGYSREEALSLARGAAGLTAQSKGQILGIYQPRGREKRTKPGEVEGRPIEFLGREVPAKKTADGIRAVASGRVVQPESVQKYLEQKFGESLPAVRQAMEKLARAMPPKVLEDRAFSLYLRFRPSVPEGTAGWGAKGELDLEAIAGLASQKAEVQAEAEFEARAAAAIRQIPEGMVATYGQIAASAGNPAGAQAVVRVLRTVAGLPWHRVVGKGGRISLPGEGGKAQRQKLEDEGVAFNPDGTVVLDAHRFRPKARS